MGLFGDGNYVLNQILILHKVIICRLPGQLNSGCTFTSQSSLPIHVGSTLLSICSSKASNPNVWDTNHVTINHLPLPSFVTKPTMVDFLALFITECKLSMDV